RAEDPGLLDIQPALYMSMIETAEIVAERYGVSRAAQDEFALISQERMAAAQQARRFDAEILPIQVQQLVKNRETGEISSVERLVDADECNRPGTTLADLERLEPVLKNGQQ